MTDTRRNWKTEFEPSYEVPVEIQALAHLKGCADHSWHNKTCPSFGICDDHCDDLIIWAEHHDPAFRNIAGSSRFRVTRGVDDVLVETADYMAAITTFLREYHQRGVSVTLDDLVAKGVLTSHMIDGEKIYKEKTP